MELVKEEVLANVREALNFVIEQELSSITDNCEMSQEEKERKNRVLSHVEFEMTERVESIKKKIAMR